MTPRSNWQLARWLFLLSACSSPGCVTLSQHVTGALEACSIKSKQHRDLAEIRRDTREDLAQQRAEVLKSESQRQVQLARYDAERQRIEHDLCLANKEQEQRQIKEKLRQSVESKIAFNVEQALEVGELEVDVEALKELIKKREEEQRQPPTQPQIRRPCTCCDQPCGCRPGLIRRHCPICSCKPCEAEKNCGGPEMLTQLQEQPQKQPLRPAEIPMKLPVRLTFGFQQPQMEETQIRLTPPEQPQRVCCPRCGVPAGQCQCAVSCVNAVPVQQGAAPVITGRGTAVDLPPTPEPDLEATSTSQSFQRKTLR